MWNIHTREYYSVLKRKEILTLPVRWLNLEDKVLSKPVTKGKKLYQFIIYYKLFILNKFKYY